VALGIAFSVPKSNWDSGFKDLRRCCKPERLGRKKPLRHLIGISEELASGNMPITSGKTVLAGSGKQFVWASIAHMFGIPGIPEWADWFAGELKTHRVMTHALGIGCDPVIIKGTKGQFLDWLGWAVESGAVRFPKAAGPISWPPMNLEHIFLRTE
jgi:hypothetical protein